MHCPEDPAPSDASVEPMKVQETGCSLFGRSRAQGQSEVTGEAREEASPWPWATPRPALPTESHGGSCARGPGSGKCCPLGLNSAPACVPAAWAPSCLPHEQSAKWNHGAGPSGSSEGPISTGCAFWNRTCKGEGAEDLEGCQPGVTGGGSC